MTYDSREKSRYQGQPVECYLFSQGANFWRFTSADVDVILPAGTFEAAVTSRGSVRQSQEKESGALEVTLPRDNPVARLFIAFPPTTPVNLTVYRAHRGEESDARIVWGPGRVAGVRFKISEAILHCVPSPRNLQGRVPGLRFQNQCNLDLYGPGCQVDRTVFRDSVLVTTVAGVSIRGAAFALRPNGWYTNGWVEAPDGELRFCVDHVGDTLTLVAPFTALISGQTVSAYAGCDRSETTCDVKFANKRRHWGFKRIPQRNPHEGRIA